MQTQCQDTMTCPKSGRIRGSSLTVYMFYDNLKAIFARQTCMSPVEAHCIAINMTLAAMHGQELSMLISCTHMQWHNHSTNVQCFNSV